MAMKAPKVQVVCITYKHEKYLAEALESFVRQKTNFPFEVLVGDDCSPDGTGAIAEEYAKRYPDIIKNIPREANMGPTRNMMDLISHCTAPYLAFCEGDDFWVDDYKLQKQYDFMEKHPEVNFCFTKTRVQFPVDWGIIDCYKPINGEIIIPDSLPGYKPSEWFSAPDLVHEMPAQTSSYFFRWNYEMIIPDWFHDGVVGDFPMLMMQLGKGKAGLIPEVTSVYRRSEVGVFMTHDKRDYFIQTRKEYVRFLYGLREYFREHYDSLAVPELDARLLKEVNNLIRACGEADDYTALMYVMQQYPQSMKLCFEMIVNALDDHSRMVDYYTYDGYRVVACASKLMKKLLPHVNKLKKKLNKRRGWFKRNLVDRFLFDSEFYLGQYADVRETHEDPRKHYFRSGWKEGRRPYPEKLNILSKIKEWFFYWIGAMVPKKKNRWVFSSFSKCGYVDNVKYMYEYVVEKHPEIEAMWMTMDSEVYNKLKEAGMPVRMMKKSRWYMMRAAVAFTDHFIRSDYSPRCGFNAATKVVQLWHGVGLKTIGDLKNTTVPGVRFSKDILPQPGDSLWKKICKKMAYIRKAPFRELFEEYYALVCPGVERVKQIAHPWGIPERAVIFSGHPRNIHLHSSETKSEEPLILYAPTYRWSVQTERRMVDDMVDHAEKIQHLMEQYNGKFIIRLHPHTWRNYSEIILKGISKYDRIQLDEDKDIYTRLGDYSVVISDYSSIAYDFILLNRPVVFYTFDIDDFLSSEIKLNYPFETHSPGAQTRDWNSTLAAVSEYLTNPSKDSDWRCRIRDEFYDMSVNDADNSGRIVRELKKRINL